MHYPFSVNLIDFLISMAIHFWVFLQIKFLSFWSLKKLNNQSRSLYLIYDKENLFLVLLASQIYS